MSEEDSGGKRQMDNKYSCRRVAVCLPELRRTQRVEVTGGPSWSAPGRSWQHLDLRTSKNNVVFSLFINSHSYTDFLSYWSTSIAASCRTAYCCTYCLYRNSSTLKFKMLGVPLKNKIKRLSRVDIPSTNVLSH